MKKEIKKKEKQIKKENKSTINDKFNFLKKILNPIKAELKNYESSDTIIVGKKVYGAVSIPLKTVYDIKKEEIKIQAENSILKKGKYFVVDYDEFITKLPKYFKNVGITTNYDINKIISKCIDYNFNIYSDNNEYFLGVNILIKKVDNTFDFKYFSKIYIDTHIDNAVYYTITGQNLYK